MLLDDLLHLESVRCQVEAAETALPRPDSLFRQVLASAHIQMALPNAPFGTSLIHSVPITHRIHGAGIYMLTFGVY